MLGFRGERFPAEALSGWSSRYPEEGRWLEAFGRRVGPHDPASSEELWRLYALSRVLELMLLSFQAGSADGSAWPGPGLALEEVCAFARALGLTVVTPTRYAAFDGEIVSVVQAGDPGEPVSLESVVWPCFMLGDLLVCRAGVVVRAGSTQVDARIAAHSTLYWAYRRKYRPVQDLSHGWGHNSQWRTSFRRDYRANGRLYLNVDGELDLALPAVEGDEREALANQDGLLTRLERTEMLTHRCFVVTSKPSDDLWPYDDRLVIEEPA